MSHKVVSQLEMETFQFMNYNIFVPVLDFIKVYVYVSSHVKVDVTNIKHWGNDHIFFRVFQGNNLSNKCSALKLFDLICQY